MEKWFKKKEIIDSGALLLLALVPRLAYYFNRLLSEKGLPQAHDTEWYLRHASLLLSNFHIDIDFNGIFYLSYYSLLALMLVFVKTQAGIVFIQMLINAASVVLVYKISILLFNRRTGILAGVFYALLWPVIYWSIYIITDSLFISLMLLQVYFLLKAYDTGKKSYWGLFTATSLYMVFFRPTGVVTLTFVFVYIIINLKTKGYVNKYKPYIICAGVVAAIAAVYLAGVVSASSLGRSLYYNMRWLLLHNYAEGRIYDIVTPYDYKYRAVTGPRFSDNFVISFFINNWNHILVLYGKRIVSFAGVWVWKLDSVGMLVRLKYILPVTAALFVTGAGISGMIRRKIFRKASILIFVVLSILFFTVFFFMDSAYRYRVPALVFLAIIGAYGVDICIDVGLKGLKRLKGMGVK